MNKRQQIINHIKSTLKTVQGIRSVHEWHLPELITPIETPAAIVRDPVINETEDGVMNRADHELTIEIDAVFAGSEPVTNIRTLIADIAEAIGMDDTFGGVAYQSNIASVSLSPDTTGKKKSFATLTINAKYRTDRWTL